MIYNGNITRLRYFQAVCRYKSMTRAAEALCISQPSLTTAIKELEKEIGVTLFNRSRNSLHLTPEGELIRDKINRMLCDFDSVYNEIIDIGEQTFSNIRLGVTPIMGTIYTPKIIGDFPKIHEDINLFLRECITYEAFELLDDRAIDIAFVIGTDVDKNKYNYKIIGESEMCLCVNNNSHLTEKTAVTCADIQDCPLVILTAGSSSYSNIISRFEEEGISPNIVMESRELHTIFEIVRKYDYSTITFEEISDMFSDIKTIPFRNPLKVSIALVWNKSNYTSRSINKLVNFISGISDGLFK